MVRHLEYVLNKQLSVKAKKISWSVFVIKFLKRKKGKNKGLITIQLAEKKFYSKRYEMILLGTTNVPRIPEDVMLRMFVETKVDEEPNSLS